MHASDMRVKVSRNNESIYEDRCECLNVNDLGDIISNIRKMQKEVNDFLTELVEENAPTDKKSHMVTSDTDSNSTDEDVEVSPKKCKFTKHTK